MEERRPRYSGEPKRKRLSFVRDGEKRYSARESDELAIYRPRTANYPALRDRREPFIPTFSEPYRSPAQPLYPRQHDQFPPPPPPVPLAPPPRNLPYRPPPMIHQDPFDTNSHGLVKLNGGGNHGFGGGHNGFGNDYGGFENRHGGFIEDGPIILDSPSPMKMKHNGVKKPKVIKVHQSSGSGRSHSYYDENSESDSFVSVHRPRSLYSDDSWNPRYKTERGGNRRRSISYYRR